MVVVSVFAVLVILTFVSRLQLLPVDDTPTIDVIAEPTNGTGETLFVYVHGLDRGRHWPSMQVVLAPHGATLPLRYLPRRSSLLSNAEAVDVARDLARSIENHVKDSSFKRLVLIGQSMGALLVKRAFLEAESDGMTWPRLVKRIVLLAGMNRGWDISGQKPSDMGVIRFAQIWIVSWAARLCGVGSLVLSTETGTPFVANVRIDWIKRMTDATRDDDIEVVQLLGDIDDLVSAEDNKDLRTAAEGRFAWIKVRGTGHGDIVDFTNDRADDPVRLGDYRLQKFKLATIERDFDLVKRENEVLPFQPDLDVSHVIFVVHGIRDLGKWAAEFERELQQQFRAQQPEGTRNKLVVASIRYGYFGMGPFLLRPIREKYVKWFMDEYTETLARYPNARQVHFVGHSNGTYLLAEALRRYRSLEIGRIAFGGSVVPQDYEWRKVLDRESSVDYKSDSLRVINYTAIDDWVVALFPRFFEPSFMKFLHNDIGSAGFNGFNKPHQQLDNVGELTGGHAAFLSRIREISAFVLDGVPDRGPDSKETTSRTFAQSALAFLSSQGSRWATWLVVAPLLAFLVIFTGWHFVTAAAEPRWPFVIAYVGLLLVILRSV